MRVFIAFLALLGWVSSQGLQVELRRSIVESNSQWTRIKLGVAGGTSPYIFSYTRIPEEWKQVNNHLYIPKKIIRETRKKFPCSLIIRDSSQNELRLTIVFMTNKKTILVEGTLYDYNQVFPLSFFNENGFEGLPALVDYPDVNKPTLTEKSTMMEKEVESEEEQTVQRRSEKESTELVKTLGSGLEDIVKKLVPEEEAKNVIEEITKKQQTTRSNSSSFEQKSNQSQSTLPQIKPEIPAESKPTRSIESIFRRFPTTHEIDEIIISADSFLISKTIQNVISDDILKCEQKIVYLLDIFGRINSAVRIKSFTLTQVEVIIESAEKQIERLAKEIFFEENEIEKLGIDELRQQMKKQLNLLEKAYDDFNQNDLKIEAQFENARQIQDDVNQMRQQVDFYYNQKRIVELQLNDIDALIENLETQVEDARRNKERIENNLSQIQSRIRELEFSISQEENKARRRDFDIELLRDRADILKRQVSNLEITVERIRADTLRALQQQQKIYLRIQDMKQRIRVQEDKLAYREEQILRYLVDVLKTSLPNIQEDIDKIYYSCFSVRNIESEVVQGAVIYLIGGRTFEEYLERAYGTSDVLSSPSLSKQVSLTTFNILSEIWANYYGEPFNPNSIANTTEFIFPDDFNCLNPSTLLSGNGRITNIRGNIIDIETQTGRKSVKLGACTRIESAKEVLQQNQEVYWKGNQAGGVVEAYSVSAI